MAQSSLFLLTLLSLISLIHKTDNPYPSQSCCVFISIYMLRMITYARLLSGYNFSSIPHKNPMNPWMRRETEEQRIRGFAQGTQLASDGVRIQEEVILHPNPAISLLALNGHYSV